MPYPPYVPPSVAGVSFAAGSGTLQPLQEGDARLSALADAVKALEQFKEAFPDAELVDASKEASPNQRFEGLKPAGPRPWYILNIDFPNYAGLTLWQMWQPNSVNGGGIGNPGALVGIGSGNVHWEPEAAPSEPDGPADQSTRIDSLERRIARIEERLDAK